MVPLFVTKQRGLTKLKTNVIKRHVRDSLKSLRRNGWMSVASISAVTVTLFMVGIFLAVLFNVNHVSRQVENDVRVRVYVERKTPQAAKDKLSKQLKKIPHVQKVTYRSRNAELNSIVSGYGSEWNMFKGDDNPLNDVYILKTNNSDSTMAVTKKARKLANVASASYGGDTARKLFKVAAKVRNWGVAFTVLLLLVAVFLISNTIRITIMSRREEIAVMRLVGATNGYIRWPFLLEGAWTGLFGSLIPIIIVDMGYGAVVSHSGLSVAANGYAFFNTMPFLFWLDLLLAGIGIVIGAAGAGLSMRRYLKV